MNVPYEHVLRDALAAQLHVIEPGLTLLRAELHLPSDRGAAGFVDLVARDRHGLLTLIEIKRAQASSREAVQELYKYVGLVRDNFGLGNDRIRCVVVSTVWHELRVPFEEFAADAPFSVEGYELLLDEEGHIRGATRVKPARSPPLRLAGEHAIFLHESSALRDVRREGLLRGLRSEHIEDFLLVDLHYEGDSPNVVYPFGTLVAIAPTRDAEAYRALYERFPDALEAWPENEALSDEYRDALDGMVLGHITTSVDYDECQFSSHEKTGGILQTSRVETIDRHGARLQSKLITDDGELIRRLKGSPSSNVLVYTGSSSPRLRSHWIALRAGVLAVARTNADWLQLIPPILDEIETRWPEANVAAQVYGPHDLLGHLVEAVLLGDADFLPVLKVLVAGEAGEPIAAYTGSIRWNGAPAPPCLDELMQTVYDDTGTLGYFCARVSGASGAYFNRVASALGFVFPIVREEWRDGAWQSGWLERDPHGASSDADQTATTHRPFFDWLESESRFVDELCSALTRNSWTE